MATLHQIQAALQQQVKAVVPPILTVPLAAGGVKSIQINVGIGWPPMNALQDAGRGNSAAVTIYDRNIARNSTRWAPFTLSEVVTQATLVSELAATVLEPLGNTTLTLSETPTLGDAVSLVVTNGGEEPQQLAADVVEAVASDTAATMAAKLAAAITADPVVGTWLTAVASGAAITLTSLVSTGPLVLASYVGNSATRNRDIGRRARQLQISAWAAPEEARQAITDPIESMIQTLANNFGLTLPDGSMARILYVNDHYIEDAAAEDVLRRDFYISADYPITVRDVLYSVLAPVPAYSIS